MAAEDGEDRVGYGRPPKHARFVKGRSGNPRGRPPRLAQLLAAALDEKAPFAAGARRRVTKREAIVAQLVDKSAGADLRAIKMLIDMWREIESRASPPPRETLVRTEADEEVVANLVARIRRAELAKTGETAAELVNECATVGSASITSFETRPSGAPQHEDVSDFVRKS